MDPTDLRPAAPAGDRTAEASPPRSGGRPADPTPVPDAADRDAELHRQRIERLLHGDELWVV